MSYQREQFDKNEQLIYKEMEDCQHQDIVDVCRASHEIWATDEETKAIIKAKKEEIALRATPDELDEAFKHIRV